MTPSKSNIDSVQNSRIYTALTPPYEPDFDPNSLQAGTTLQQMSSTMDPITPTRFAHIAIKTITIVPTGWVLFQASVKILRLLIFSVGLLVGFAVLSLLPVLLKNKLKDKFD